MPRLPIIHRQENFGTISAPLCSREKLEQSGGRLIWSHAIPRPRRGCTGYGLAIPCCQTCPFYKGIQCYPCIIGHLQQLWESRNTIIRQWTPFNSQAMASFCQSRNIEMEKIPPLHPSANPAETFMKSVGKTMKIAHQHRTSEKDALSQLLSNYRDTPHPATGITPNDMLFRDPPQSSFPRRNISEQSILATLYYYTNQ